jgi:hypothetical protein
MAQTVFTPMSREECREKFPAFQEHLAQRDGELDLKARRLSRRDASLQRLVDSPVRYQGPFDKALFAAQYREFDKNKLTPEAVQILLVFVKLNATEAYAVDRSLAKDVLPMRRSAAEDERRLMLTMVVEEFYHTKLLLSASQLFGVDIDRPYVPARSVRALIQLIERAPEEVRIPVVLGSEYLGVLILARLLVAIGKVFHHDPAVRDALEERVIEVLIDEVGHVTFNRMILSPSGFRLAERFFPAVFHGVRGFLPDAAGVGVLPMPWSYAASFRMQDLPEEVMRRSFLA